MSFITESRHHIFRRGEDFFVAKDREEANYLYRLASGDVIPDEDWEMLDDDSLLTIRFEDRECEHQEELEPFDYDDCDIDEDGGYCSGQVEKTLKCGQWAKIFKNEPLFDLIE